MQDPVIQLLLLLGPISVILTALVLVIWLFNKNNEKRHRIWRQEAEAAGLSFMEGGGAIEGPGLFAASVETEIYGPQAGGSLRICRVHDPTAQRKYFTQGSVDFEPPMALGLAVRSRGLLSFGDRIKTGDARFDARFSAQGGDSADLSSLTPAARTALLELLQRVDSVELDGKGLRWRANASMAREGQITGAIQATVAANEVLQTHLRGRALDERHPPEERRATLPAMSADRAHGRSSDGRHEAPESEAHEVASSRRRS